MKKVYIPKNETKTKIELRFDGDSVHCTDVKMFCNIKIFNYGNDRTMRASE